MLVLPFCSVLNRVQSEQCNGITMTTLYFHTRLSGGEFVLASGVLANLENVGRATKMARSKLLDPKKKKKPEG